MISYGSVDLVCPTAELASWLASRIPTSEAFAFMRPKSLGDSSLNPRPHFAWFLSRPMRLNTFFDPWGASRFGYSFVIADHNMMDDILEQNESGEALPLVIDDGLGASIETDLFMLPPIPLSKINVSPSLPLFLVPLVDDRFYWWERAAAITVTEGTTTWAQLYASIATGLGISLSVDTVNSAYLKPGVGLGKQYQHLPMLLDWVASSVGQRIVRRLDGTFAAINPSTGSALMISQANTYRKYAGGSLALGVVDA